MSRHDTLTLTLYEEHVKKGSPKHTEDVVDGIIELFNQDTHELTHEPSGIIHIVFNRNVKRIQRNTYYHSILQFLLLTYKDVGFPTIREAIRKLFIWPSLKLTTITEYLIISSFYSLEFTLVCMEWVNTKIGDKDSHIILKAALDAFDNSHSNTSASICQLFYYTVDNEFYHIVNNIFRSCLQIYTMLSSVGLSMFTTFSINRLLSSYMWGINSISDDWYSPDDFISGAEECSLNVENRQEPYKRYNFLKTIYKENRFIKDILKLIRPVSSLQSVTPAESIYSTWAGTTTTRRRELDERLKKKSLSKSKGPKRGGKKKRSRCCSTRRTRRR
jgi:hypothetical protein